MDVHCSTCGEPWEVYQLQHKAIFQTSLPREEAEVWHSLPPSQKLSERYRELFRSVGLEFGDSVLHVRRCPCCRKDASPNPEVEALKFAIVKRLGDDEDAIVAAFKEVNRVRLL